MPHRLVIRQDLAGNQLEALIAAYSHQQVQKQQTEAAVLPGIADNQGELGRAGAGQLYQSTHPDDFPLALPAAPALGNHGYLAVVVYEAEPRQPLVGDAQFQLQELKVAAVYAARGKQTVKPHHKGLVLGSDGADRDWRSVL